MVAGKNQRHCAEVIPALRSVVATNRGAGDYWLGTRAAMLRAFRVFFYVELTLILNDTSYFLISTSNSHTRLASNPPMSNPSLILSVNFTFCFAIFTLLPGAFFFAC